MTTLKSSAGEYTVLTAIRYRSETKTVAGAGSISSGLPSPSAIAASVSGWPSSAAWASFSLPRVVRMQ
ncbi:hypothetical protein D3C84_1275030 [compost metagenome]